MKRDMIQLPIRFGFHEYYDSQTGKGYGSSNFSWTSALFLDLIYEYYDKDKHGILRANARPPYGLFRPFRRNDIRRNLSLEDLDPRIHFALVCGSRSCAPIDFWKAESVDAQLEKAAAHFINSSEVIILPEQNKVFLSQIFKWYKRDFGGKSQILNFVLKYLRSRETFHFLEKNIDNIRVEYLFYDWNLNH